MISDQQTCHNITMKAGFRFWHRFFLDSSFSLLPFSSLRSQGSSRVGGTFSWKREKRRKSAINLSSTNFSPDFIHTPSGDVQVYCLSLFTWRGGGFCCPSFFAPEPIICIEAREQILYCYRRLRPFKNLASSIYKKKRGGGNPYATYTEQTPLGFYNFFGFSRLLLRCSFTAYL